MQQAFTLIKAQELSTEQKHWSYIVALHDQWSDGSDTSRSSYSQNVSVGYWFLADDSEVCVVRILMTHSYKSPALSDVISPETGSR